MNRCFAFVGALLLAFIAVSSACTAAPAQWVHFSLEPGHRDGSTIHASFRNESEGRNENDWSTDFRTSEFVGLDTAGFRAGGTRPLRFAIIREAGRLDCVGHGGESYAAGDCSFGANPQFSQLLVSRGIERPTDEQSFGLMAVNARRDVIDAVTAAHYPTPSIDDLMALSALGVSGNYIASLAHAGYRPRSISSLIQFKALGITPEWIGGFAQIGYANVPAEELVQLKALDITPQFVAGFDRVGYKHLPVDTLVQLKALNITPEFVRSVAGNGAPLPPVNHLVEIKMFGRRH